jgi:hypothetical protein
MRRTDRALRTSNRC